MGDAENSLPSSKKRAAGRELNRDRPELDDEEDASEQEGGTFKKASDDVLATRRIVKVRRNQAATVSAPNPFAGIHLVAPAAPVPVEAKNEQKVGDSKEPTEDALQEKSDDAIEVGEKKINETEPVSAPSTEEKEGIVDNANDNSLEKATVPEIEDDTGNEDVVDNTEDLKKPAEPEAENNAEAGKIEDKSKDEVECNANSAPLSSFQQLSSTQNAFTGVAGTGFSTSTFSFGSVLNGDQPSFGFGLSNNGSSSMFSVSKGEGSGITPLQEVVVETGEENEAVIFNADSVLFEYLDGSWKERGKGEIRVNVSKTEGEKARILMRTRGNFRLVLNASLYPEMKLTSMDKKGVTFACVNGVAESKGGLSTFALKFKDASIMEEFRETVIAHKGKATAAAPLKTPENTP
ncbi:hypothetical protein MLD38_030186 [Melastoma candidum]|uniref:Uncharacterized protein n=1 Tax=Melastoma candidum TaxID=119954 RepID=A0ACB9ML05_9MYRT|nr:hypothetical protein MLD38_030186 [Melastoma candidum]